MIEEGELKLVPPAKLRAALRRIARDPECGKPLTRDLSGCRSLRVGGSENRIVYRILAAADRVEILSVERRREDEAYKTAARRLR